MRYCGLIGYFVEDEISPGVWVKHYVWRKYYGDILNINLTVQANSESINDKIRIKHEISIVADPYASNNYEKIVCAEFKANKSNDGPLWKVESVRFQLPRLILSLSNEFILPDDEKEVFLTIKGE